MVAPVLARATVRAASPYDSTELQQAHTALTERSQRALSSIERARLEYALDRLAERPERRAGGARLAENLRRNAAKVVSVRVEATAERLDARAVVYDKEARSRLAVSPALSSLEEAELLAEAVDAARQIRAAVDALSPRARMALRFKACAAPLTKVAVELNVGKRQYNKLVARARAVLAASPAAVDAYRRLAGAFNSHPHIAVEAMAQTFGTWGTP